MAPPPSSAPSIQQDREPLGLPFTEPPTTAGPAASMASPPSHDAAEPLDAPRRRAPSPRTRRRDAASATRLALGASVSRTEPRRCRSRGRATAPPRRHGGASRDVARAASSPAQTTSTPSTRRHGAPSKPRTPSRRPLHLRSALATSTAPSPLSATPCPCSTPTAPQPASASNCLDAAGALDAQPSSTAATTSPSSPEQQQLGHVSVGLPRHAANITEHPIRSAPSSVPDRDPKPVNCKVETPPKP
ncbi:predicted GPI-anchored protein 58 [Sorghum bicolor]|uniref:predicted GPI-anchored protein 58 n=1 Tax=Sorghum bicolor TaxID=4558 RepID=UPI000B4247B3|nr:predicted GPI-anchored protein 58 [Sorghum bicolor]|eukprot:XP_021319209.1 predicted GPI-anchored protein 58 [Sorghum bicolor]